jgi:type I restriction enzyme R subunit
LFGLERQAAVLAFNYFINGSTARPNQIEFIDLVVHEPTQNRVMEADRLYQTPFIDISPQGPEGNFPVFSWGAFWPFVIANRY